ncbi:MAG: ATP synthase F1 subunit delta [Alphaproteobacteria bacterium]|nr:ATP synthase F1 subunit delta [Alphaproteobacteria bacterium]
MASLKIAHRYALCLYNLAVEQKILTQIKQNIDDLDLILNKNPEFSMVLFNPIISPAKKNAIFTKIFKNNVNELTFSFLMFVLKKRRENILKEIVNCFNKIFNAQHNIHELSLTLATDLDQNLKETFVNHLKSTQKFDAIQLNTIINPDIIGGFILEFDFKQIDGSIKRDLNDIKKHFQKNEFIKQIK